MEIASFYFHWQISWNYPSVCNESNWDVNYFWCCLSHLAWMKELLIVQRTCLYHTSFFTYVVDFSSGYFQQFIYTYNSHIVHNSSLKCAINEMMISWEYFSLFGYLLLFFVFVVLGCAWYKSRKHLVKNCLIYVSFKLAPTDDPSYLKCT